MLDRDLISLQYISDDRSEGAPFDVLDIAVTQVPVGKQRIKHVIP